MNFNKVGSFWVNGLMSPTAQLHANHEKLWQIEEAYAIFKRATYDEMQLHPTMESVLSQGWWSVDILLHLGAIQHCNVASLDM
jgi:hypothetical protein